MIKIRKLKESDLRAVATIHVECWQEAYKGLLPQKYLDSLDVPSRQKRWENGIKANADVIRLVAVEKSQILGFIVGLENRSTDLVPEANSEIWALYVDHRAWGKGAGKALMAEFLKLVAAPVLVWVLETNDRGRKFYEAMGGKLLSVKNDFVLEGQKFPEAGYLFPA